MIGERRCSEVPPERLNGGEGVWGLGVGLGGELEERGGGGLGWGRTVPASADEPALGLDEDLDGGLGSGGRRGR
jgi:hypothetical protein